MHLKAVEIVDLMCDAYLDNLYKTGKFWLELQLI